MNPVFALKAAIITLLLVFIAGLVVGHVRGEGFLGALSIATGRVL